MVVKAQFMVFKLGGGKIDNEVLLLQELEPSSLSTNKIATPNEIQNDELKSP